MTELTASFPPLLPMQPVNSESFHYFFWQSKLCQLIKKNTLTWYDHSWWPSEKMNKSRILIQINYLSACHYIKVQSVLLLQWIQKIYRNWFIQHCNATTSELRLHYHNTTKSQEQETLQRRCNGNLKDKSALHLQPKSVRTLGSLTPLSFISLSFKEKNPTNILFLVWTSWRNISSGNAYGRVVHTELASNRNSSLLAWSTHMLFRNSLLNFQSGPTCFRNWILTRSDFNRRNVP